MKSFTYLGPIEFFTQEGGYAAPGMRLIKDEEDLRRVGFFIQLEAARERNDLVTVMLADLGVVLLESHVVRRIKITVEVDDDIAQPSPGELE